MTTLFEPDADGWLNVGDVPQWFGLLPEGCGDRTWLAYLEAVTIGMDPEYKITVPLAASSPATRTAV